MKLNELLNPEYLLALYNSGTSLNIEGPPGIGKSQAVQQFPVILGKLFNEEFGYCEQLIPNIDPPDVRGIMFPTKRKSVNGTDLIVSQYAYPGIIPTPEYLDKFPRGVWFGDEFEQGDILTKKALAPMILKGDVGEYSLGNWWMRVTASNRMQDRSGVVKALMHVVNRRRTVQIEFDIESWLDWARGYKSPTTGKKLHPLALTFASQFPGVVCTDAMPQDSKPFCSPRSYTSGWDFLTALCKDDEHGFIDMKLPTSSVVWELVQGDIGEAAVTELRGFTSVVDEFPPMQDILDSPTRAKIPNPKRLDAAFAVSQMCMHYVNPDNFMKIWTYMERLPLELQASLASNMSKQAKITGALLTHPTFTKWLSNHTALITASSA